MVCMIRLEHTKNILKTSKMCKTRRSVRSFIYQPRAASGGFMGYVGRMLSWKWSKAPSYGVSAGPSTRASKTERSSPRAVAKIFDARSSWICLRSLCKRRVPPSIPKNTANICESFRSLRKETEMFDAKAYKSLNSAFFSPSAVFPCFFFADAE